MVANGAAAESSVASRTETKRPNVLFICVDDLKPLLGCYGETQVKSPQMDRLAASGLRFDRAYCNQAVCSPSRNALLTGLRPTTLGVYDLPTFFRDAKPDAITIGQWFKQHGWRTEALGKVFHTANGNHEDAASWSVPHWSSKARRYARKELTNDPSERGPAVEIADGPDNALADGMIADEAIRRLRKAKEKPSEPWMLFAGFHKPHLPFVAPRKYWELYDCNSFWPHKNQSPPEGAPKFAPTTSGELRRYADVPDAGPISAEQQRELIHGYHAAVSYTDAQIGRVLDELAASGFASNTIVVLWGDHGWHLGDHGAWAKHDNYEHATRLPLLIRAPGVTTAGSASTALVESVDIFPTLCDLAGLPQPKELDGTSFLGVLKNPKASTKEAVFHVYPRSPKGMGAILGRAVRTERYRLVEWKKPGGDAASAIFELYDYQTDPDETKNLAAEKPEVVAQLRAILAKQPEAKPQWRAPTNDADADSAKMKLAAVFTSGQDGYHTYRIPAIVVTTNQTVLAFCEGRKNSRSDSGDIDLLLKRSTDGGKTWSAQQLIWSDAGNTCGNPAPVVDQTTGKIWLLMTWNDGADKEDAIGYQKARDTRRVFVTHSADDGLSWTKPQEITASVKKPEWGWYATGPVNGIQLMRGAHKGRLVIPANHSAVAASAQMMTHSHIIFSDDHGATWQLGGIEDEKTNESTIVELSDGSLLHNMRSYHKKNRRAMATSKDGGATWSPVKLDDALIEPVCQASILRGTWPDRGGKSRILFANPASEKREKMTVKVSYDEGKTWAVKKLIHAGPAAYSCLTVLPDKTIALLFERGEKGPYETIALARFPVSWLEQPE
jgi:iduronate 2-sulfatase